MKFRTIIRMQMILTGLGAALLLAGSAYAQQDTNPTIFPDGGNVEPFRQPAAVTTNNSATFTMDASNAAVAQQVIAKQTASAAQPAVQEASGAPWTTADVWAVSLLLAISITLVSLYGLARAKKTERRSETGALTTSRAPAH